MSRLSKSHISVNAAGVPIITGTGTKVVEVILDHIAHCSDAQEIHREFPHLSLAAIYSALAYYYDHQVEMDEELAQRLRKVDDIKAELDAAQGPSPIRLKLKAQGLLR